MRPYVEIGRDEWVEVRGRVADAFEFMEPVVPRTLGVGQALDLPFQIPALRLGPPSPHAGTELVVWAVEARWDIEMGRDERVAALVDVRQHRDLLGAGVIPVGGFCQNSRRGKDRVTSGPSLLVTPHSRP